MGQRVTLIPGDGTDPEPSEATRRVLDATGVDLEWSVRLVLPSLYGDLVSVLDGGGHVRARGRDHREAHRAARARKRGRTCARK